MFASTADELLKFFRSDVDDQVEPYLWTDVDGYGYMTEGFDALLKRAEVKYEVLALDITSGVQDVALPARVLHIRSAHIVGGGVVYASSASDAAVPRDDYGQPLSSSISDPGSGTPSLYVRDYRAKALRLLPVPNANAVLEIQCSTTIGIAMEAGVVLPTMDAEDLRLVLHYMKSLAYQKHDAETEDLVRAKFHEDRFRVGVLDRESRLRNMRRPPGTVRMSGW